MGRWYQGSTNCLATAVYVGDPDALDINLGFNTSMAKKNIKRYTMSVHQVIVREDFPHTLATVMDMIRRSASPDDLKVNSGFFDKASASFPSFPRINDGVAFQIGLYEEGAAKSTIKPSVNDQSYALGSQVAPAGSHFLEHEVAAIFVDNVVLACNLGKRSNLLLEAISQLADNAKVALPPGTMAIANRPNRISIQTILEIGVESLSFGASTHLGSLPIDGRGPFDRVFGRDFRVRDVERAQLVANVTIAPNQKKASALGVEKFTRAEWLDQAAVAAAEGYADEGYTIKLADGSVWKDGDLKLTKGVDLPRNNTTFDATAALAALNDYRAELVEQGQLR